jgi:hypothetical protein
LSGLAEKKKFLVTELAREDDISDDLSEKAKECSVKELSSRSSRGLKVLSMRMLELVFEKQVTTYKEVAYELIQELLREGKMNHDSRNVISVKNW